MAKGQRHIQRPGIYGKADFHEPFATLIRLQSISNPFQTISHIVSVSRYQPNTQHPCPETVIHSAKNRIWVRSQLPEDHLKQNVQRGDLVGWLRPSPRQPEDCGPFGVC